MRASAASGGNAAAGESAQGDGRRFRLLAAAILLAAAGLRLVELGREPLWMDEATIARAIAQPLPALLRATAVDNQAPAFALLTRIAVAALGDGEGAHRVVSALAGIAAVAATMALGRRLHSPTAGLFAGLLLAIHPLAVHYSREARPHALLSLAALGALASLLALERRPSRLHVVVAASSLTLVVLTHALGAFFVTPLCLAFAWRARALGAGPLRAVAAASLLGAAGCLSWIGMVEEQARNLRHSYHWATSTWEQWFPWQVPASIAALSPGGDLAAFNRVTSLPATAVAGALIVTALAAVAVVRRAPFARTLAVVVLGALVLPFVVSLAGPRIHVVGRVESAIAPLALLLAAMGASSLPPAVRRALAAGCVALALPSVTKELFGRQRFESNLPVVAAARAAGPGDVVVVTGPWLPVFEHYMPRLGESAEIVPFPGALREHPHWTDDSDTAALAEEAEALAAALAPRACRIVVVLQGGPSAEIARALSRHRAMTSSLPLPRLDVEVQAYEPP